MGSQGHRAEGLKHMLVELAAHLFHDRKGLGVRKRQPVGTLLHQRRVDIHDRCQAHDVADLIAVQAIGISGAVKEFVMVQTTSSISGGKPPWAASAS